MAAIRPKPTRQLLTELCGGNQGLISAAHHGLVETPLDQFYPNLDLDEVVTFAASSWKSRDIKDIDSSSFLDNAGLYDLFSQVYAIGMPWLKKHRRISYEKREEHSSLNPFGGMDLRRRLAAIPRDAEDKLREQLKQGTTEYVFECQYRERKMQRGGDNYKLEIMSFQNAYPREGRIVPAFVAEVTRILSGYPRKIKESLLEAPWGEKRAPMIDCAGADY
jgi:hypothetical protein